MALFVGALAGAAVAQDFKTEALRHAKSTTTSVDLCQAELQTIDLSLQLYRLVPNDPKALSPAAAARRIGQCGEQESRQLQASMPTVRDDGPCRVALEDLHASALAHLQTIAADPSEPLAQIIRRTRGEATALRQKAVKTRLSCQ